MPVHVAFSGWTDWSAAAALCAAFDGAGGGVVDLQDNPNVSTSDLAALAGRMRRFRHAMDVDLRCSSDGGVTDHDMTHFVASYAYPMERRRFGSGDVHLRLTMTHAERLRHDMGSLRLKVSQLMAASRWACPDIHRLRIHLR